MDQLKSILKTVSDLKASSAVLQWDQETFMPEGSGASRASQIETLERLAHEMFTGSELADLMEQSSKQRASLSADDQRLLEVVEKDLERSRKLPSTHVAEFSRACSLGLNAWRKAREESDFGLFEDALSTIVRLNQEKSELIGFDEHPYDALLDEFEPGMLTSHVDTVFTDLKSRLVPIVKSILDQEAPDDSMLFKSYDKDKQWDFGMSVIESFGFDMQRGRQDLSAHPFTTSFSIDDVRLTTRVEEEFFPSAFFGTVHECGHGLYEQGIDPKWESTSLADGTSLGMHESQSRFWENQVGRSRAFWNGHYADLQKTFSENLSAYSLEQFYAAINKVSASLIRVEADEVTYNLHVMLRFDIEKQLISGDLSVKDLPEFWNETMASYLGLRPENDSEGCLQDIHWSMGAFGYFPTYTLGTLMSSQLTSAMEAELGDLSILVEKKEFLTILNWLRTHIHSFGRSKSANQILRDISGEELTADHWLKYIESKYRQLYPQM